MTTRRGFVEALSATGLLLATGTAFADNDDKSPMRLLVGLAPGGGNDIAAHLVADKLTELLGRPVIVDSRPGAGQRIALGELRRAKPDGKTLMLATNSPFTIYPHIYAKLDYDPVKDFTPIAGVMNFDIGVAVGPKVDAPDLGRWIAWAKANPTQAAYGTPGAGTLPQFIGIAFSKAIGVEMTHVPYKGGTPAMTDLVGGQLPLLINGLSDMTEMHHAGRIRVIAVTGEKRSTLMPEVPTLMESGIPVSSVITVGIFGPADLPPALVARLNNAITQAMASPEVRERFVRQGLVPATATPQALAASLAAESKRLKVLVAASGYVPE